MFCAACDRGLHRACTCGRVRARRERQGATMAPFVHRSLALQLRVSVGTECSGIDAPVVALRRLGIPHAHLFSTEKDVMCRVMHAANFAPSTFHDDITTRDARSLPDVDLYVCGFPCQPFSYLNANTLSGTAGGDARARIPEHVLAGIEHARPASVLLENVPRFATADGGEPFRQLLDGLARLGYETHHAVLCATQFNVPQRRRRLYIVGLRRDRVRYAFAWPPAEPLLRSVHDILDPAAEAERYALTSEWYKAKIAGEWELPAEPARVVALTTYEFRARRRAEGKRVTEDVDICPCLTAGDAHYVTHLGRLLTPEEALALQGFTKLHVPRSLTDRAVRRMAGNSMCVDVMMRLVVAALYSVGRVAAPRVEE